MVKVNLGLAQHKGEYKSSSETHNYLLLFLCILHNIHTYNDVIVVFKIVIGAITLCIHHVEREL